MSNDSKMTELRAQVRNAMRGVMEAGGLSYTTQIWNNKHKYGYTVKCYMHSWYAERAMNEVHAVLAMAGKHDASVEIRHMPPHHNKVLSKSARAVLVHIPY